MQAMTLAVPYSSHLVNNFVLTPHFRPVAVATKLEVYCVPDHLIITLSYASRWMKDAPGMNFSFLISFPAALSQQMF